ncbi:MAG TPA: response regulator [Flavisolibacter sp.]|nr:response regulator [Flavisolibacter sp.]
MTFSTTILCMDDDVDDLAFIQEAIKNHSTPFTVVEAKNGEEGIAWLYQAKASGVLPCLIIMDINMPKMDGRRAIQIIKQDEEISRIPLVVFTTSSSSLDKRYFELYQVDYITKPNQYQAFNNKVSEMLSHVIAG